MRFKNRERAAQLLVRKLTTAYKDKNPLVFGVPCGDG